MALVRRVGRAIGLDVHRDFGVVAICEDGKVRSAGRVPSTPEGLRLLAESLLPTDRVALEVTASCWEVARLVEPHVQRVVVVSPDDTGIARARAKTDKLDARALASCQGPVSSNDSGQLEPMIDQAVATLQAAGIEDHLRTVLADGGYWNSPQITQLGQVGIDAIVPTKAATRTKARTLSPRQGPEAERIGALLDTPQGAALYRRRQHMIEPVFGNTKFNRRISRFHRRGLSACRAEWRLIAAIHNLLKLYRAGIPAPAA
jgi:hypothetical protein